ncbi:MAG: glycosyltransferase, partial [Solirubrobacterales bacterium]|nr:glycosyltransferase [Solirubrobacterales bacterium]
MIVIAVLFWLSAGLIFFTHFGYPIALGLLNAIGLGGRAGTIRGPKLSEIPPPDDPDTEEETLPAVSLVIAAYNEETVIEDKVANAIALEYPRELLQIIVASDGSSDRTVELAKEAGADLVLDLPRGGKVAGQNAAAEVATGSLIAFSDANSIWEPGALAELIGPFR